MLSAHFHLLIDPDKAEDTFHSSFIVVMHKMVQGEHIFFNTLTELNASATFQIYLSETYAPALPLVAA